MQIYLCTTASATLPPCVILSSDITEGTWHWNNCDPNDWYIWYHRTIASYIFEVQQTFLPLDKQLPLRKYHLTSKWSVGIQIELKKYFTVFHYIIFSIFIHACYCLTNSKCILNKTRWCCAAIQVWVDIGLRKWPAAWQHQAIACTSADYRQPIQVNRIHSEIAFLLRTVSWETPRPSKFAEDFMPKKFHSNIPGTNRLTDSCLYLSLWSCHNNTSATLPPCRKYMYVCGWQCITEHRSDFKSIDRVKASATLPPC